MRQQDPTMVEDVAPTLRPVAKLRSFGAFRSISALMLREMATTYGRTSGGYLWAILEPVGGIALLTIIFSLGFRDPPIGKNFAIFYATGLVPFTYYSGLAQKIAAAIQYSRQLMAYPAVTYLDALIARLVVNMVTGLLVALIVLAGIYLLMDTRTDPKIGKIALSFAMATALGTGVGTLNCYLFPVFPVWAKIWMIVNRPMFIMSCVLFPFDAVPQPWRDYLWWNPLVHVVGQCREGFYRAYDGSYVSPLYVFLISAFMLFVGLALLHRYHRSIVNN